MPRFRDRRTGRFVSETVWKRSHDGRFVRESFLPPPIRAEKLPPPDLSPDELEQLEEDGFIDDESVEYAGAFDSP